MSLSKTQRGALLQSAVDQHRSGDLAGAVSLYRHVLAADPSNADALSLLGVALHQLGASGEAVECLRRAVKSRRKDAALHYNLGTVLLDTGDLAGAEAALRSALTLGSREPHVEMNLANAIARQGKGRQALPLYEGAVQRAPRSALVWFNYGNALRDLGHVEQALDAYRKACALDAHDVAACINLGELLHRLQRVDQAEQAYREALARGGDDPQVQTSLAHVLLHAGRTEEARQFVEMAIARQPQLPEVYLVQAEILRAMHRFEAAEASLRQALALAPDRLDAKLRLAELIRDTGRDAQALECYEALAPAAAQLGAELQLSRAIADMRAGRYAAAWEGMQARVLREQLLQSAPQVAWCRGVLPLDLHGKTVYVQREQGLGDELLYLRFMPALRVRGATVLLRCGEKLRAPLERAAVADRIDPGLAADAADYFLSVGDLPWALQAGIHCDPVPPAVRLAPLPERVQALRERLAAAGRPPYLGLTWRAGTALEEQQGIRGQVLSKRIDPRALGEALREVDGTLIVMQRGLQPGEIEALARACGRQPHDFGAWNDDLDDALALLAALDEYIAVSNTNMHLAAGLGRRARVLLHFPPEWRWYGPEGQAPFFPGFALYPQAPDGSWDGALARLRSDLLGSGRPGAARASD